MKRVIKSFRKKVLTRGLKAKSPQKANQLVVRNKVNRVITVQSVKTLAHIDSLWTYLKFNPFISLVIIPWALITFYLVFIKSPIYESSARILIEQNGADKGLMVNIGFLGRGGGSDSKNVHLTNEYITSREMLHYLEKKLKLKEHYASSKVDWFSRLPDDAKEKKRLEYFDNKVTSIFDPLTGELSLHVQAFDAHYAYTMLKEIVFKSKLFANRVANTLADEQLVFTERQLKKAKQKLYTAAKDVLAFQNQHKMFDPKETARVIGEVMAGLKSKLVEKQTELITYSAFMNNKSSKIKALKEQIAAYKNQIRNQTAFMLGGGKGRKLNNIIAEYQWLELKQTFAHAEYVASQKAYDIARLNASKQQNLLIETQPPNLPDDYEYPKKLYDTIAVLVCLLILFALFKMTNLIVQEHID